MIGQTRIASSPSRMLPPKMPPRSTVTVTGTVTPPDGLLPQPPSAKPWPPIMLVPVTGVGALDPAPFHLCADSVTTRSYVPPGMLDRSVLGRRSPSDHAPSLSRPE